MAVRIYEIHLGTLKENPDNLFHPLNDREYEGLKRSIEKYGIKDPLIVTPNGSGYTVVCGHNRLRIARELGIEYLPCIVDDEEHSMDGLDTEIHRRHLTNTEKKEYILKVEGLREKRLKKALEESLHPKLYSLYEEEVLSLKAAKQFMRIPMDQQEHIVDSLESEVEVPVGEDNEDLLKTVEKLNEARFQIKALQEELADKDKEAEKIRTSVRKLEIMRTKEREELQHALEAARSDATGAAGADNEELIAEKDKVIQDLSKGIKDLNTKIANHEEEKQLLEDKITGIKNTANIERFKYMELQTLYHQERKKLVSEDSILNRLHQTAVDMQGLADFIECNRWPDDFDEKVADKVEQIRETLDKMLSAARENAAEKEVDDIFAETPESTLQ